MKTAKVLVQVVQLECPHCHRVVARGGVASIHVDMAEKWAECANVPQLCLNCRKQFSLPVNPFKQEEASHESTNV